MPGQNRAQVGSALGKALFAQAISEKSTFRHTRNGPDVDFALSTPQVIRPFLNMSGRSTDVWFKRHLFDVTGLLYCDSFYQI